MSHERWARWADKELDLLLEIGEPEAIHGAIVAALDALADPALGAAPAMASVLTMAVAMTSHILQGEGTFDVDTRTGSLALTGDDLRLALSVAANLVEARRHGLKRRSA
jgi:hypothetical protein